MQSTRANLLTASFFSLSCFYPCDNWSVTLVVAVPLYFSQTWAASRAPSHRPLTLPSVRVVSISRLLPPVCLPQTPLLVKRTVWCRHIHTRTLHVHHQSASGQIAVAMRQMSGSGGWDWETKHGNSATHQLICNVCRPISGQEGHV